MSAPPAPPDDAVRDAGAILKQISVYGRRFEVSAVDIEFLASILETERAKNRAPAPSESDERGAPEPEPSPPWPSVCDVCHFSAWEPVATEEECAFAGHPHDGEHVRCGYCWLHDAYMRLRVACLYKKICGANT